MGRGDLTVHGFRSTFRDWAAEGAGNAREVAPAHTLRDRVEVAYRRGDRMKRRRRLMAEWVAFCAKPAPADAVVPLRS
jgi:integrase